ncbi:hypothetical protein SY83_10450 [Paenibacillus swuensis]|uniref:Beta-xylosidase C-terminal Concanavalin A-like domain-containing protein n=1 Tax=Paenibacillus swuensis TaxID=1178515 RepID=A0A172THV9_9BACL|nr:glycoside hydrolase family 43 protein [Paenibacillus swuensis]ANE46621.1 hypothetical protein SY83_10450 [Paenibacillus swuensis]
MRYYSNPLPISLSPKAENTTGLSAFYNPDPYVLKYNGEYYSYATSLNGVVVLHSIDLVNWTHLGYAFQQEGEADYWAPAVFYENGLFYLYYSSRDAHEEDVHYEFMKVAVAERPEGPYEYKVTLFDTFSIDAHVVRDADGELVLFYSTNETLGIDSSRPGTVILADRLLDPLTLEGKPRLIIKPTLDEEIYEENRFGDGRDWHTIEGAFHFKRRNKHYVMYSGNAFTRETYYIGYSSAEHRSGSSITDLDWVKYPDEDTYEPLLCKNKHVEGVGHNSVAIAPNNVDPWVVYHGRHVDKESGEDGERRQMRMDPMYWEQDRMWVPGPTYTEQAAPAMPSFLDRFDRADQHGLSGDWVEVSGEWGVSGGEALQASRVGKSLALAPETYTSAVFEANVKWVPHHMGGLYGVVVHRTDADNYTEILLNTGKRKLIATEVIHGIKHSAASTDLSSTFRFDVYHRMFVTITGSHIQVELDDIPVLSHVSRQHHGQLGLSTHYTSARFDGIAVTRHLSLSAETANGCMNWIRADKGEWILDQGALIGNGNVERAKVVITKPEGMDDSFCRMDLLYKGSAGKKGVVIQLAGMDEDALQPLILPPQSSKTRTCQTVMITHLDQHIQVWLGRELILSQPVKGTWTGLKIETDCAIRIEALEWTER